MTIPKVLRTAQHTKRKRLDAGDKHELLQYVHYDGDAPRADVETVTPPDGFLVRLCKAKPAPTSSSVVERHTVLTQPPQHAGSSSKRTVEADDERLKVDKGKIKEEASRATDDKPKSKSDKRAEEKDRKKREKEEQVRKKKLEEEAEVQRRKEAAEKKKKGKATRESKMGTSEQKGGENDVKEVRKDLKQKSSRGKERERKESSSGKGKSTPKPSPERSGSRLTKVQTKSTDVLKANQRPTPHRSSGHASLPRPRTPSFDTGLYPAHAIQHLRGASASHSSHPYPAMQRPVTIFGTYANSRAPPVVFPAEPMSSI